MKEGIHDALTDAPWRSRRYCSGKCWLATESLKRASILADEAHITVPWMRRGLLVNLLRIAHNLCPATTQPSSPNLPEGTEPDAFQAVAGEDRLSGVRAASCRRESRAPPDISLAAGRWPGPWLDHAPLDGSVIPRSGADRRPRQRAYALRPQHRFVAKGPGEAAGDTGAPAPWRTQAAWVPAPPDATEQWVHR